MWVVTVPDPENLADRLSQVSVQLDEVAEKRDWLFAGTRVPDLDAMALLVWDFMGNCTCSLWAEGVLPPFPAVLLTTVLSHSFITDILACATDGPDPGIFAVDPDKPFHSIAVISIFCKLVRRLPQACNRQARPVFLGTPEIAIAKLSDQKGAEEWRHVLAPPTRRDVSIDAAATAARFAPGLLQAGITVVDRLLRFIPIRGLVRSLLLLVCEY